MLKNGRTYSQWFPELIDFPCRSFVLVEIKQEWNRRGDNVNTSRYKYETLTSTIVRFCERFLTACMNRLISF